MKFYHLSHTDLDGYGCQLISKYYFQDKDRMYLNANYGLEVTQSLEKILNDIKKNKEKEIFFLISDLNLTKEECESLDKEIAILKNNGFNIKLQLLDHHKTGQESAELFSWYYLDDSKSATKIVYEYFINNYSNLMPDFIKDIVDAINAIDIWLEEEIDNFEFGKVLTRIIKETTEINDILFNDYNRDYKLHLIKKAEKFLDKENKHILLDDNIFNLKKDYLKAQLNQIEPDTIDNLSANLLVKMLKEHQNELTIYYNGYKGLFTYTLGSISIPANAFLVSNPDYDFFMDLGRKGTISIRANGNIDVSLLAKKLANGGGHPNASGGRFYDFEETIDYFEAKEFIINKLSSIEG